MHEHVHLCDDYIKKNLFIYSFCVSNMSLIQIPQILFVYNLNYLNLFQQLYISSLIDQTLCEFYISLMLDVNNAQSYVHSMLHSRILKLEVTQPKYVLSFNNNIGLVLPYDIPLNHPVEIEIEIKYIYLDFFTFSHEISTINKFL